MSLESLLRIYAELGIKLALKDNDRLQVDSPKGALTASLRDALIAHKPDLIATLKARQKQESSPPQALSFADDSEFTESRPPARPPQISSEATSLIREQPVTTTPSQFVNIEAEVNKVLSGSDYDVSVMDSKDVAVRQIISAQLLSALAGENFNQHGHARGAFFTHGYFDDTVSQLQTADSAAERAAAARKLGVVRDPKASPYLIALLQDGAPDLRRAAVESLGQIGDPAAIAPLNELLLRETSRQLPEAVIRHAINSITVTEAQRPCVPASPAQLDLPAPKREIFADYLSSVEPCALLSNSTPSLVPVSSVTLSSADNSLEAAEEELRQEEAALRKAADALERKRAEAETARTKAEEEARMKAECEAQVRKEIEARIRAEEETRRRMAAEAERQKAEEEARVKAEQEARSRAQEEALLRAEEEALFRLEAETLKQAAEELARKRSETEAARKLAEEQARLRAAEEARLRAEEEARVRAREEARREAEEEMRRRVEEELRRRLKEEALRRAEEEALARAAEEARVNAELEARVLAELEAKRKAEEEVRLRAEEELRAREAEETHRRAEEERRRREVEKRQRAEEVRLRLEQETLMQVAAD